MHCLNVVGFARGWVVGGMDGEVRGVRLGLGRGQEGWREVVGVLEVEGSGGVGAGERAVKSDQAQSNLLESFPKCHVLVISTRTTPKSFTTYR